ncbi:MAG: hypothetical protein NT154_40190 [Verrucomicrobia bacterium]|nr:hypothetical protein [Verrucomicrobiota bacterium]
MADSMSGYSTRILSGMDRVWELPCSEVNHNPPSFLRSDPAMVTESGCWTKDFQSIFAKYDAKLKALTEAQNEKES